MNIQVDTREHKEEWKRVQKQFDAIEGVSYFRSKLYVGDYQSLDNPRLVIDRKKDLQEICGNVRQQHERFKKELLKAMDAGIQIVILIEHGSDIQCLEDVIFFNQPEMTRWRWKTVEVDSKKKKVREKYQQKAINGNTPNLTIEVKITIALLLARPPSSIDKPSEIIIKGIAPSAR